MAQVTIVTLTDDITGEPADETVVFGLDGKDYELDLTTDNAKRLRESLNEFKDAARPAGRTVATRKPRGVAAAAAKADRDQNQAVRAWAKGQGLQVSDRGRIPQDVQLRFDAAH